MFRMGRAAASRLWPLVVLACTAGPLEPPAGFTYSAATPDCGPADGPAVSIYLAGGPISAIEPPAPHIRVYIWEGVDALNGRSLPLTGPSAGGSAQYVTSAGFTSASAGEVTIAEVRADTSIEGTVELDFPSLGRVRGTFSAAWVSRTLVCG